MQRVHQILFAIILLATSWFAMLAIHEMGHILAGLVTGGSIKKIVLYPFTISSTEVSPNPNPGIVAWCGPLGGVTLPLLLIPCWRAGSLARQIAVFFAGFCLIANGAYLGFGWIDQVGDCQQIAHSGSPIWTMPLFGLITFTAGLLLWHQLGSIHEFFRDRNQVTQTTTLIAGVILTLVLVSEFVLSPR